MYYLLGAKDGLRADEEAEVGSRPRLTGLGVLDLLVVTIEAR